MAIYYHLSLQPHELPYVWKCQALFENVSALHALYLRGNDLSVGIFIAEVKLLF